MHIVVPVRYAVVRRSPGVADGPAVAPVAAGSPPSIGGLSLALVSAAAFGTSGSFAAALLTAGWSPGAAVTTRVGVAALLLMPPAILQARGRWPLVVRRAPMILAYGGAAVAGAQLCYFNAVQHLSIGVALLLEYLGTLLVVGWMWARHGQRPRKMTVVGGALAMLGLVVILNLFGSTHVQLVGVGWGLGAAAGLAVYFVLSAADEEPLPPLVVACGGLLVAAASLGLLTMLGALSWRANTADVELLHRQVSWLVAVLGLAVVAAAIAYVSGIAAARRLGARLASFVGLAEVMFAVPFGWLLVGQVPGIGQLAGGVLIVAGIVVVRAAESRPQEPAAAGDGSVIAAAATASGR